MLFATLLRSVVRSGSLVVIDSAGRRHWIGDASAPRSVIRLTRRHLGTSLACNPKLSIGEAYVEGSLRLEQGSVTDLLTLLARNLGTIGPGHWLNWGGWARGWLPARVPVVRARRNVAHHYDLSPALYGLFLAGHAGADVTGRGCSSTSARSRPRVALASLPTASDSRTTGNTPKRLLNPPISRWSHRAEHDRLATYRSAPSRAWPGR